MGQAAKQPAATGACATRAAHRLCPYDTATLSIMRNSEEATAAQLETLWPTGPSWDQWRRITVPYSGQHSCSWVMINRVGARLIDRGAPCTQSNMANVYKLDVNQSRANIDLYGFSL